MKKTIQRIVLAVWLLSLTVSTMGFNLHTLYCYCTGEQELSLFDIEHECPKKHAEEDAFLKKLPPCCQKAMACHKVKNAEKDHDCTQKGNKFIKADLKFLEIEKVKLPKFNLKAIVWAQPKIEFSTRPFSILNSQFPIPIVNPPPQYFGRQLLNFIQVYRC
jgi:hypothetical protein